MNQPLSTSLSSRAADDARFVRIEQKDWDKATGRTTALQGIQNIGAAIFGGSYADANCGGAGEVGSKVYLYPSSRSFHFECSLTWGTLGHGMIETVQRDELQQCNLQESVTLDYPPSGAVHLEWLGECCDEKGIIVPRPATTTKGSEVFLTRKIYGTLRASYPVFRKVYTLTIPEREDSIENNFQSVAVARWSGGLSHKEITLPENFEETKGYCGNGSTTVVDPDRDEEEEICKEGESKHKWPISVTANRRLRVNYCKQSANENEVEEEIEYGQRCSKHAPDYDI